MEIEICVEKYFKWPGWLRLLHSLSQSILPHRLYPHSEVQQFRDEVRNSPEVKFAVHAFAAVNSNNFVRFFKLVKGASYLASCLLHRYFNQVSTCS